jgi:hypothetical protein
LAGLGHRRASHDVLGNAHGAALSHSPAPNCTLLDVAVLQSTTGGPTPMSGVLSDALRAYIHLLGDELGEPLAIDTELAGAMLGATSVAELTQDVGAPIEADHAQKAELVARHEPAQVAEAGS